jgi:hypothetical protein
MKKLVPESIEETLRILNTQKLNEEGKLGSFIKRTAEAVKGAFKKVGQYFVSLFQDTILPVMLPVNIGILKKEGKLPQAVQFVPDAEDIKLDSSLSKSTAIKAVKERVKKGYLEDAAKNKARRKLQKLWESVNRKKLSILNEAKIDTKYVGQAKMRNVGSEFLVKRLMLQYRNPKLIPPLIWGAPGIGKTAITNAVINSLGPGHRLIDVQTSKMSPDDWTLPAIVNIAEKGKEAVDIPKNWLPVYEPSTNPEENARRNDAANWGEGGIIFLDELSRASEEVQNTCLKLVHQRIIGDKVLGSKWAIVAATNREEDDPDGGQTKIGSALANRFQHFNFVPNVEQWLEWGRGKKMDSRILIFVEFNRDHFYLFDNEELINTTPRTWEALSDMLAACQEYGDILFTKAEMEDLIGGTIHASTVEQFVAFLSLIETISPAELKLIFTNPDKAPKPTTKNGQVDQIKAHAIIGAVCSQSKGRELSAIELENYVTYWVNLGNQSTAGEALFWIVEIHPYIHQQTGDIKDGKHDKYKKAMDIYRKAFGTPPTEKPEKKAEKNK